MAVNTIQSGIKQHENSSIVNYALFMGGTNVVHDVLACYDPLTTGYGRLFMVRKPEFLVSTMGTKIKKFKHILEYGNTEVSGLNDVTVNFNQIQGGYTGKSFEIPSYATDDTTSFTVKVYEFSGSPVREVLHSWINGTSDLLTGLTTYNGATSSLDRIQANQTAEFIYVNTDRTGLKVEYACLLANCFPRGINTSAFNYTAGEHNLVESNIEFACTKYESIQINKIAARLISKYRVLANSLNFYSGYKKSTVAEAVGYADGRGYDVKTGKLKSPVSAYSNTVKPLAPADLG